MQLSDERPGPASSPVTLPCEESLLSEAWTQTDSLSIPVTFDLGTQTDLPDQFGNLVEARSSPDKTGPDEDSRWSSCEPPKKGAFITTNPAYSSTSELEKRENEISKFAKAKDERCNMAKPGVSDFNYSSKDAEVGERSRSPLVTPLTVKVQSGGGLLDSGQHPVKPCSTSEWQGHAVDDVIDGTVKNDASREVTEHVNSYRDQGNAEMRGGHPSYSSSATADLSFQGESVIADDSPRLTDYVGRYHGVATSSFDASRENHTEREASLVGAMSLTGSQGTKSRNKGHLPQRSRNGGRFLGLKGGRQDPSFSSMSSNYKLDELLSNWEENGAKPKKVRQGEFDASQITKEEKESDFFGIKPSFLARHTDDSSITTTTDAMWNMENSNERLLNNFSRYNRSCYFTDEQSYQGDNTFPTFHSKDPEVSAGSQGLRTTPISTTYGSSDSILPVWSLKLPAPPLLSLPCDGSERLQNFSSNDSKTGVVPPHVVSNGDMVLAQTPYSPRQRRRVTNLHTDPEVQWERNFNMQYANGNAASNATSTTQGLISPGTGISALTERATRERQELATKTVTNVDNSRPVPPGLLNSNSSVSNDDSLAALERRVAEACSLVERTLKEREEREKTMKERERRRKEERAMREQQERERRERQARETMEAEHRNESGEGISTSSVEERPSQNTVVPESPQWLCEHYQRLCRVKFPCCGKFYPCHRCHNNSGCRNDNSKAKEAFYVECSVCKYQQEVSISLTLSNIYNCGNAKFLFIGERHAAPSYKFIHYSQKFIHYSQKIVFAIHLQL